MRIIKIETKNFRAFGSRPLKIDLTAKGKNLLVYGENGSGKSSLFYALKDFLECADREAAKRNINDFPFRNIFATATDDGFVKLELTGLPRPKMQSKAQKKRPMNKVFEWSAAKDDTGDQLILETNKTKGFIDYKALLATYFIQQDKGTEQDKKPINIFSLIIDNILRHAENDITRTKFGDEWKTINENLESLNYRSKTQIQALEKSIKDFNDGLRNKLDELQDKAKTLLDYFKYQIKIQINYGGVKFVSETRQIERHTINLKVEFFAESREDHHLFLNEAKLSAIAISIFFAALLLQPESRLRILALDDVLIGLDMSNRLPVLEILHDHFDKYQIFFFTYDKAWYEIVRQRVGDTDWKNVEFYSGNTDAHDLPIYAEDSKYFEVAEDYLAKKDYKAAMVYLRTHLEIKLKKFCDKRMPVLYHLAEEDFSCENFWDALKKYENKDGSKFLDDAIIRDIETYRRVAINQLCHASFASTHLQ